MEDNDDVPCLSAETFAALQEFYKEQECLKSKELISSVDDGMSIEENWQLSQFWYDEATIEKIASITLECTGKCGKIGLISCPSLFTQIKNKLDKDGEVDLYEFDERFAVYGQNFNFYDYKKPLEVPADRCGYYDLIIADPPFLSEECLTKTCITIKHLSKEKIILCTGAIMTPIVEKLLNLKKIDFEPKHKRNLGNIFCCFTNFEVS